ncbi:MAG: hypothetical protein V2I97_01135 [Desulfococcaceae bacterium]|nr:hypothetical protein [Desulfococcaceae bacterium]
MLKHFKIVLEKHPDGYVAYPLGLKGIVVGEGDSYEDALADVQSAIEFHIETFGHEAFSRRQGFPEMSFSEIIKDESAGHVKNIFSFPRSASMLLC